MGRYPIILLILDVAVLLVLLAGALLGHVKFLWLIFILYSIFFAYKLWRNMRRDG